MKKIIFYIFLLIILSITNIFAFEIRDGIVQADVDKVFYDPAQQEYLYEANWDKQDNIKQYFYAISTNENMRPSELEWRNNNQNTHIRIKVQTQNNIRYFCYVYAIDNNNQKSEIFKSDGLKLAVFNMPKMLQIQDEKQPYQKISKLTQSTLKSNILGITSKTLGGTELPERVMNTTYLPPVGDQGSQGSCTGWGVGYYYKTYVEAQEHGWVNPNPAVDPEHVMSPAFIYNLKNHGNDNGIMPSAAFDVLENNGCATWQGMPYNNADYWSWPTTRNVWENALKYKSKNTHTTIDLTNDVDILLLKQHLANSGVAVLSFRLYSQVYDYPNNKYPNGIESGVIYKDYGANVTGHTACIIGYDDNKEYYDEYNVADVIAYVSKTDFAGLGVNTDDLWVDLRERGYINNLGQIFPLFKELESPAYFQLDDPFNVLGGIRDDIFYIMRDKLKVTKKKGAFLVVNQWGADWGVECTEIGNKGFFWVSYDYFKNIPEGEVSQVNKEAYFLDEIEGDYKPDMIGIVSVEHLKREELRFNFFDLDNVFHASLDYSAGEGGFPVNSTIVYDLSYYASPDKTAQNMYFYIKDVEDTGAVGKINYLAIQKGEQLVEFLDVPFDTVNGVTIRKNFEIYTNNLADLEMNVLDGLKTDIDYQKDATKISANWSVDQAQIARIEKQYIDGRKIGELQNYFVYFSTNPYLMNVENINNWQNVGKNLKFELLKSLEENKIYYAYVFAKFEQQSSKLFRSNGIKIDTIQPKTNIEVVKGASNFEPIIMYFEVMDINKSDSINVQLQMSNGVIKNLTTVKEGDKFKAIFVTTCDLPNGEANFTVTTTDLAGNVGTVIEGITSINIDTSINYQKDETIAHSSNIEVLISANTFSENMQLTINEFSRQNLIKNFALESISQAMNFKIKNSLNDEITNFSKPVILKFPYDPVNLKNKGINEDNLKIFYLNELTEKLEVIPTTIDKINHFVIASVTHFSVYQLLAQKSFTGASNIIAYPNPCKMDESNLKIAGFDTNKNVEIKIYDITGKLIKKLNNFDLQIDNGLSVLQWNGRDQGGLRVATGVYIYVAKIDGAVKIEKVAIFQ